MLTHFADDLVSLIQRQQRGGDHWKLQPRDPHTGEWIDSPGGVVASLAHLAKGLGNHHETQSIGDERDRFQVHSFEGGRAALTGREDDPELRRLLGHYSPEEARELADLIEDMSNDAEGHDPDDFEDYELVGETGWVDDNSTRGMADGTYVAYDRDGNVHLVLRGDEEGGDHRLTVDDANRLAEALRDIADSTDNAVEAREEREAEEREKAEAWWEDAEVSADSNAVTMHSPTGIELLDTTRGGSASTDLTAEEIPALVDAIRQMHAAGDTLPDYELLEENDYEPDLADVPPINISDQHRLRLYEDGDMRLENRVDGMFWETMVWRDSAVDLADGLEALLARILAGPQYPATRSHTRRGDHWKLQPRDPHTGEWADTLGGGVAKDLYGIVGKHLTNAEQYDDSYEVEDGTDFEADGLGGGIGRVYSMTNGDVQIAVEYRESEGFSGDGVGTYIFADLGNEDADAFAERVWWAREVLDYDLGDRGADEGNGLIAWKRDADTDIIIGADGKGTISLLFADEPELGFDMTTDQAHAFARALESESAKAYRAQQEAEIADADPDEVDYEDEEAA